MTEMAKMQQRQRKITGIRRNQIHVDPKIPKTLKMVEFVPVPVGMKQVFFAGDLFRCTLNTGETGWRTSVVDMNEGTSGGFKGDFLKLAVKMFTEP
jgi:peptide chain release factor 1